MAADAAFMEKLVALCKRRGFIFQSSEIYGGIGGFWDYGPLGVELKRNIKNAWWHDYVTCPPDGPDGKPLQMLGLDSSIIMNPKVWEASGHATGFADPMQSCRHCRKLYRADQVEGMLSQSEWYISLAEEFELGLDDRRLSEWIRRIGRKKSPGLAIVRDQSNVHPRVGEVLRGLGATRGQFSHFVGLVASPMDRVASTETRPCPSCGGDLTEPRQFNLMFDSHAGAVKGDENKVYLRPETAQGIFVNFKNVLDTSRVKIPFGIAQVGKAFRNEINPRNFTFRSREFEQMEIEFFCRGAEEAAAGQPSDMDWYQFWRKNRYDWYVRHGLKSEKLRLRDQAKEELAHYSRACADIEYLFPFSDEHQELEGCAHRGCFDLSQHEKHSGVDLHYFDEEAWARCLAERKACGEPELTKDQKQEIAGKPPYRFVPTVIEPSAGADRATLAFLCEAYTEDSKPDAKGVMQTRVYLRFHPRLAPIKAAFLPLVNKEGMPEVAEALYREARRHFNAFFDDGGSIGRRYARMDEAGTPYCITIDGDTVKTGGENAGTVTIRDRDTLEQVRVSREHVVAWLRERIG
ncbi:MAG: glycine--tRNA ligase [Phycisphaerae bacterium]